MVSFSLQVKKSSIFPFLEWRYLVSALIYLAAVSAIDAQLLIDALIPLATIFAYATIIISRLKAPKNPKIRRVKKKDAGHLKITIRMKMSDTINSWKQIMNRFILVSLITPNVKFLGPLQLVFFGNIEWYTRST